MKHPTNSNQSSSSNDPPERKPEANKRKLIRKLEHTEKPTQELSNKPKPHLSSSITSKQRPEIDKITHYFHKLHQGSTKELIKGQIISTPDKESIEKMDIELHELEQTLSNHQAHLEEQTLHYKLHLEEYTNYLKNSRALIITSLLTIASIDRKLNEQNNHTDNHNIVHTETMKQLAMKIEHNQQLLSKHSLDNIQYYFVNKQNEELKKQQAQELEEQELRIEKCRLARQESSCRFALEHWPILARKYQVLSLLGKGGYSEVYKAYNLITNQFVAIKLSSIEHCTLSSSDNYFRHITREYQIHQQLDHVNIAKLIEIIDIDSSSICIVLEYCEGPELSHYLRKHQQLPENEAKMIIKQIVSVLKYLQEFSIQIIHYDLKPQNIIFHNGRIKILDFGLCKLIENGPNTELTSQGAGTYWYLPPETFKEKGAVISNKVDVWSMGVIFFEMVYGKRPFGHGLTQKSIMNSGVILNAKEVEFPDNVVVSEEAKRFIKKCLEIDPDIRYDPTQAAIDAYLKDPTNPDEMLTTHSKQIKEAN